MVIVIVKIFFTRRLYKLNTPEYNEVNRSQSGSGTDFKQDIVENKGNNCFVRSSTKCFKKCIIHLTAKKYTEDFWNFIRAEQIQSNVTTEFNHFVKNIIYIGRYDGFRVCSRFITERNIASSLLNNHFCLIWKSNVFSFNKAIEGLKTNFHVVDNVKSDKIIKVLLSLNTIPKRFNLS